MERPKPTSLPTSIPSQDIKLYQPLHLLPIGKKATISQLMLTGDMRRRLLDLGFIVGTKVQCLYHSPLGDPTAYLVRGTVIALRQEDASQIIVAF
ncbi:MAG: ferrous iron transport protein A [Peptococcaceae bacterium]|nr:ferrous iron transport protein A [Peptococcaceae bacterium]